MMRSVSRYFYRYPWKGKPWCKIVSESTEIDVFHGSLFSQYKGKIFYFDDSRGIRTTVIQDRHWDDYKIESEVLTGELQLTYRREGFSIFNKRKNSVGSLYIDGLELELIIDMRGRNMRLITAEGKRVAYWQEQFGCGWSGYGLILRKNLQSEIATIILALPLIFEYNKGIGT